MAGEPTRGYAWPPAEPGNQLALRHGAYSRRKVEPVAMELVAGLLADRPDLERHPEEVWAWARAEGVCLLVAEDIAEHGLFSDDGELRGVMARLTQFERLAAERRATLGLNPRAEADLVRARVDAERGSADVESLRAAGRQVIEAKATDRAADADGISACPDCDGRRHVFGFPCASCEGTGVAV